MKNTTVNTTETTALSTYIKEVERIPLLSRDEEYDLAVKAKNGDLKAREKLITSNSRFVIAIAKKFQGRGLSLEDLICEGNIGLIMAIDKFEPEKGFHFISYGVWWIRQAILKAIADKTRMIRLPMNRNAQLMQVENAKYKLMSKGLETSIQDIAKECNLDEEEVKEILSYDKNVCSLDVSVGDEEGASIGDFIESETDKPEEEVMEKSMKEQFDRILSAFSSREREIIIKRYGLFDTKPMSLKEVGDIYGLTKERIRQIEKNMLKNLANNKEVQEMKIYIA